MAHITFKGQSIETAGSLPKLHTAAPEFVLVRNDLSETRLSALPKKKKLLNIFPSLDTGTCATSVKSFHSLLKGHPEVLLIDISKDLPFAQARFCRAESLSGNETLSAFRSTFAKDYGLEIKSGPLTGLCSRVVIVLDENNQVLYTEQVAEISKEPNYDKALASLLGAAQKAQAHR